ncbi:MAG: ATP-binding cassette domain-containing protein [Mycoplasma sp.]|nr:ATP-binding cassette domain-containing protein [Candidatus Hennigella equi]
MNNGPFIQLKNIAKRYDDGYLACSKVNVNIDKGKFVTILGPSGCGKTTLLKMLAGFEMPSEGKIIVNGVDIKELPIHMRPTATVFQDYALFPNMTIYENICYGLKIMRTQLENVPNKMYTELAKVKKNAIAKATKEILELRKDQVKLDKDIIKAKLAYSKHEDIFKIQDMRFDQFQTQIYYYERQMAKHNPDFDGFKLTGVNKRKIWLNRFRSALGIHQFIKFNTKGMSNTEKKVYNLIRLYTYKQPIDKKVDKLVAKYNDADQWISYWENYPQTVVEQFEKIHTTRPLTKKEIDQKAKEVIELVGLEGSENKYPSDLSGGMQQRVALARAIVVKPEILLLDEPLSALDAKVRHKMQEELKRIHNELKINFILVTHDQEEALRLSDQIIVMSKGRIEQIGSPRNIYEHPSNSWVANFIGQANFVDVHYLGNEKIKIGDKTFKYPITNKELEMSMRRNLWFKLLIRPEDVEVCSPNRAYMMMRITSILYKGTVYEVKCIAKDKTELTLQTNQHLKVNDKIGVRWDFKLASPIMPKKREK